MTTKLNYEVNLNSVYMFAFRYALGRRTFASSIVSSFLSERLDSLSDFTISQMIKEIDACTDYGDECDKATWYDFRDTLMREIYRREDENNRAEEEERINWCKKPVDTASSLKNAVRETIKEQVLKSDNVNHPSHYNDGKIEPIDYIEDKKLNFHLGNVVKYVSRAGKKNPDKELEDLKKARWYLDRYIEKLEE